MIISRLFASGAGAFQILDLANNVAGSFKWYGSTAFKECRYNRAITASTGNWAFALARAYPDMSLLAVLPDYVPQPIQQLLCKAGISSIVTGSDFGVAESLALEYSLSLNLPYLGYDDPSVQEALTAAINPVVTGRYNRVLVPVSAGSLLPVFNHVADSVIGITSQSECCHEVRGKPGRSSFLSSMPIELHDTSEAVRVLRELGIPASASGSLGMAAYLSDNVKTDGKTLIVVTGYDYEWMSTQ